jgi:hypothetical protein
LKPGLTPVTLKGARVWPTVFMIDVLKGSAEGDRFLAIGSWFSIAFR